MIRQAGVPCSEKHLPRGWIGLAFSCVEIIWWIPRLASLSLMTVPVSEVCSAGLRLKPAQYKESLNTVAVPSVGRGRESACRVSLIVTDNVLLFAIIRDISVTYIWGAAVAHGLLWTLHGAAHQQRRGQRVENKQVNTLRYKCFFNSNFYFWAYTIII